MACGGKCGCSCYCMVASALVWSADKFLSGAASAVNFGIPKIIIGLTIVLYRS